MVVCSKSWIVFAKSMISRAFSPNEALFATFCWKVHESAKKNMIVCSKSCWKVLGQIKVLDDFSCCFTNWATFWPLLLKSSSKHQNMVVCSKQPSIWPKLSNFSNKVPYLCVSMNFSRKSCKKVPHFVKKDEKSSIWQNLATFRTNYDVFAYRWTFQEKVAKSASFREKARKIVDLAKTRNFSNKLPCFGVSMNF